MVALVSVVLVWPAGAAAGPGRAELAFEHAGRIWSLAGDGSGRVPLTPPRTRRTWHTMPAWAPDGGELVMSRVQQHGDETGAQLVVRSAAGDVRSVTQMRPGVADLEASWSPDRRLLAFTRRAARSSSLFVLDPVTGETRTVARQPFAGRYRWIGEPRFYPDGRRLLYTRVDERRNHLRHTLEAIALDGSGRTVVARDAEGGVFSPDGSWIAFSSDRDRNGESCGENFCRYKSELYVMRADGTGARRLTRNRGFDATPSWSADGSRIAFASSRNAWRGPDSFALHSIRPDGRCLTWLTNGTPDSSRPSWRPGAGSPDPGGCGAVERKPLVDVDAREALAGLRRPVFWLGEQHRGSLLDSVYRGAAFIGYFDCGRFDPRDCMPPDLQMRTESVCSLPLARLARARWIGSSRGALAIDLSGDGIEVLTGRARVSIFRGSLEPLSSSLRRSTLRALRPLAADRPPARLARPVIPRQVARLVGSAERAWRRFATVDAGARALGISKATFRGALRFGRILRNRGPVRTAACKNRRARTTRHSEIAGPTLGWTA
jgi:Tol biopolymer transport system component